MNWAVLLPLKHWIVAMSILRFGCCLEFNTSWIVNQQTCKTLPYFLICCKLFLKLLWETLSLGQQTDKRKVSMGDCQLSPVQNFLSVVEPFQYSLWLALRSIQRVIPDRRRLSSPNSYLLVPKLVKNLNSLICFKLIPDAEDTSGCPRTFE